MPALGTITNVWQTGRMLPMAVIQVSPDLIYPMSGLILFPGDGGVSGTISRHPYDSYSGNTRQCREYMTSPLLIAWTRHDSLPVKFCPSCVSVSVHLTVPLDVHSTTKSITLCVRFAIFCITLSLTQLAVHSPRHSLRNSMLAVGVHC